MFTKEEFEKKNFGQNESQKLPDRAKNSAVSPPLGDFAHQKVKYAKFSKRGQLGWIEFKYLFVGLLFGVVIGLIVIYLSTKGVIPFHLPYVCPAAVKP